MDSYADRTRFEDRDPDFVDELPGGMGRIFLRLFHPREFYGEIHVSGTIPSGITIALLLILLIVVDLINLLEGNVCYEFIIKFASRARP